MNMKVTDLNPLSVPSVKPGTATARPKQTEATSKTNNLTEVSLTSASQSAFGSRAAKIAELKSVVSSGGYKPNSQSISEKLVSGALSRPE